MSIVLPLYKKGKVQIMKVHALIFNWYLLYILTLGQVGYSQGIQDSTTFIENNNIGSYNPNWLRNKALYDSKYFVLDSGMHPEKSTAYLDYKAYVFLTLGYAFTDYLSAEVILFPYDADLNIGYALNFGVPINNNFSLGSKIYYRKPRKYDDFFDIMSTPIIVTWRDKKSTVTLSYQVSNTFEYRFSEIYEEYFLERQLTHGICIGASHRYSRRGSIKMEHIHLSGLGSLTVVGGVLDFRKFSFNYNLLIPTSYGGLTGLAPIPSVGALVPLFYLNKEI